MFTKEDLLEVDPDAIYDSEGRYHERPKRGWKSKKNLDYPLVATITGQHVD